MMRKLSYGLLFLLMVWGLLSCAKEEERAWDGPVIKLDLWCRNSVNTKADVPGDESLNENLIKTVDLYFYPGGQTSSAATYHYHQEPNTQGSAAFLMEVTSDLVNTRIFPVSPVQYDNALVLALVNCPSSILSEIGNSPTLAKIHEEVVTTNFVSNAVQDEFIMTGSVEITRRDAIVVAEGNIELERLACKLTVGLKVADQVDIPNPEGTKVARWEPMLKGMSIYLVDGVSNATLGGEAPTPSYVTYRDYAKYFIDPVTEEPIEKVGDYLYTEPMYMYPQHWVYGSTESPVKEPYLKLVIPWHRLDYGGYTSTQKQYYYKILIPEDERTDYKKMFASNNWYHINVDVKMLGSDTDDAKVALQDGLLYIAYWQDKDVVIKHATVGNARYLSVNDTEYSLNNLNTVEMGYTSSHPIEIVDVTVTRPYYGTMNSGDAYGATIKTDASGEKYLDYSTEQRKKLNNGVDWLSDTGTSVKYTHVLNNDYNNNNFDYSPYTVTFTIAHKDKKTDERYRRTIKLIQYPGIYIEATHNPDAIGDNPNSHYGYVYVNGDQLKMADFDKLYPSTGYVHDNNWRIVHYHEGGKDMYKINVTVLPAGSPFVIGDPRTPVYNNLDYTDFEKLPVVGGSLEAKRSLRWYHPTEISSRTTNMLAPSYRLTSKFYTGIEKDGVPFKEAQYRCASIQENGFPAGRWRLPTWGEINFISNLSSHSVFEVQFSKNGFYWAADGRAIYVDGTTIREATKAQMNNRLRDTKEGKRPIALMRCVYDSWYWGDEQVNIATPMWGDAPLRGDPTE